MNKKRGKNFTRLKHIFFATGIGLAFVTMCFIIAPVSAGTGHLDVRYLKEDWNWVCEARAVCNYDTSTYLIVGAGPWTTTHAIAGTGIDVTVLEIRTVQTSYNIEAYIRANFDPWFADDWTSEADAWCYPAYLAQQTGGYYHEW